ncbi:MAG: hypothetical protein AB8G22_00640 [Saprospiraceae bacterium]
MDAQNQKLSDWLENLQRESWNLELIISGFSIFLLFQANEALIEIIGQVQRDYDLGNAGKALAVSIIGTLIIGTGALILNLVVHIAVRGIWVGTVGLRSVQKTIDFERLNYSSFFTEQLRDRLTNLDKLIVRLDNFCSSIFAFTFLVFFMFLSFVAYFFWAILLQQLLIWIGFDHNEFTRGILVAIVLTFNFAGIFYFIDTFTGGLFKKYRRVSKFYLPIYRIFTTITLSFVYRSIYYTFLSRYRKSYFCMFLFGYVFIIFNIPFFRFDQNMFFPDNTTAVNMRQNYYDNLRQSDAAIRWASIPSDRLKERYFPLFINYQVENNAAIQKMCSDYKPSKQRSIISGYNFERGVELNDPIIEEADSQALLNCLSRSYQIYLNDSLLTQPQFFYFRHPNQDERGIRTMINTEKLAAGQHQIKIMQWELEKDSLVSNDYATLPFWLEK